MKNCSICEKINTRTGLIFFITIIVSIIRIISENSDYVIQIIAGINCTALAFVIYVMFEQMKVKYVKRVNPLYIYRGNGTS